MPWPCASPNTGDAVLARERYAESLRIAWQAEAPGQVATALEALGGWRWSRCSRAAGFAYSVPQSDCDGGRA